MTEADGDVRDDSGLVMRLNVGGTIFMTTRHTVIQSPFFEQILEHRSNRSGSSQSASRKEKYFVRLKNREYFVDRNPACFRDILEFLRTGKTNFLDWDCSSDDDSKQLVTPSSDLSSLSRRYLHELREEAHFFELEELAARISERLSLSKPSGHADLSWLDTDGPHKGIRKVVGTRIAFAVSNDNYCRPTDQFTPPPGFKWASQAEYLCEYNRSSSVIANNLEWVHFNVGGWEEYTWKFTLNFAFLFRDSFLCGRFVHAGMKLNDISHVALFSMHAEHIDFNETKGIQEAFGGLVLLADDVLEGPPTILTGKTTTSASFPPGHSVPSPQGVVPGKTPSAGIARNLGTYKSGDNAPPPDMALIGSRPTKQMAQESIMQQYGGSSVPEHVPQGGGNGMYNNHSYGSFMYVQQQQQPTQHPGIDGYPTAFSGVPQQQQYPKSPMMYPGGYYGQ